MSSDAVDVRITDDGVVEDGKESPDATLHRLGVDALKWAEEFNATAVKLGYSSMDVGWLIGWFACAIERSSMTHPHVRRLELEVERLRLVTTTVDGAGQEETIELSERERTFIGNKCEVFPTCARQPIQRRYGIAMCRAHDISEFIRVESESLACKHRADLEQRLEEERVFTTRAVERLNKRETLERRCTCQGDKEHLCWGCTREAEGKHARLFRAAVPWPGQIANAEEVAYARGLKDKSSTDR